MRRMKRFPVVALLICSLAAPAMAADDEACKAFVAAFGKANKAVTGKDLAADDAAFWKKQCAKKPDAEVKKDTACLDKVKGKDDMGKCMK